MALKVTLDFDGELRGFELINDAQVPATAIGGIVQSMIASYRSGNFAAQSVVPVLDAPDDEEASAPRKIKFAAGGTITAGSPVVAALKPTVVKGK